jgi:predicted nucleic acid-binding protein
LKTYVLRDKRGEGLQVILDNSTYSRFARCDAFWILEEIFEIKITWLIKDQIKDGCSKYPKLNAILESVKIGHIEVISDISQDESNIMGVLPKRLGSADNSCIAIAQHRDLPLVTDDQDMVGEANNRHIKTIETKEVFQLAIKLRLLDWNKLSHSKKESVRAILNLSVRKKSLTQTDRNMLLKQMGELK